jgi:quercetin dioxygenase-like cupin family protein
MTEFIFHPPLAPPLKGGKALYQISRGKHMAVVKHFSDVEADPVTIDGAVNTKRRLLLGTGDGVPLFSVRMFEISPRGQTPYHSHDFEHEIFVLEGTGELVLEEGPKPMPAGTAIFIPPGETHCMKNNGDSLMKVLCMVPKEYE